MEERINKIEELLNANITTHPNLVKLWKEYLKIKKENLEKTLSQCEKMVENIDNICDQSPEELFITSSCLNTIFSKSS